MRRAVLVALVAGAASGCASAELRGLRNDLDQTAPGLQIQEGRSFSFGPMTLGLARLGLRLAGDDDDADVARAILGQARRVQFAHYDVLGDVYAADLPTPRQVRRYEDEGWTPAITVRDGDEAVWILANDRADEVLFVTLSSDGLTLAKVRGDLTEIARIVLRESRLGEGPAHGDAAADTAEEARP